MVRFESRTRKMICQSTQIGEHDAVSGKRTASAKQQGLRTGSGAGHQLVLELMATAKLAWPMVLAQLGQIGMMATDLASAGRIGPEAVAAVALAGRIYLVSFTFGMGLLAAITPLAAQAFGADNLSVARRSLRMGLWLALLLSLPMMAFTLRAERILLALGQVPGAALLAQQYLFGLTWSAAPALCFLAIRSFLVAVNRPEPVLWITVAAIPVKTLLVYLLMYGKLGLPRLELFGAGLATSLVNCALCSAGFWFAAMRRPFRDYHLLVHLWRFDWPLMRQLIVIGTPISISFLMDYGFSSAAALLMGTISTAALAAHQIAFQVAATMFIIPSGISMAAAVRVAHAFGRDDGPGVKRAGLAAMLLGTVIVVMLSFVVIVARFRIAEFFLGDSTDVADAARLAAQLVLVGASSFISAAIYTIASGSLRGMKDTRAPVLFAGVAYWLIGFSLSYVVGLKIGLGPIGVWIGLSIGATVYAALLVVRFHLLAGRLARQNRCADRVSL